MPVTSPTHHQPPVNQVTVMNRRQDETDTAAAQEVVQLQQPSPKPMHHKQLPGDSAGSSASLEQPHRPETKPLLINQSAGKLYDTWWEAAGANIMDEFVEDWLPNASGITTIPQNYDDKDNSLTRRANKNAMEESALKDQSLAGMLDMLMTTGQENSQPPVVAQV